MSRWCPIAQTTFFKYGPQTRKNCSKTLEVTSFTSNITMRLGGWKFISWYHSFRNKSESFDSVCSTANMPINSIEFVAIVPCFKCYINLTSMHCTLEGIHSSYMTAEGTACELLKHKITGHEANTVQWTSYHPCTEALDVATWLTMTLNNFYPSWSIPMCWNRVNSLSKKR